MENLGLQIKKLLSEKHMSQKTLAEKSGCTQAAISLYIKGERTPRASVLSNIALALGTTTDYLTMGTPNNKSEELDHACKLIAKNATQMSREEKMKIIAILFGEEN